MNRIVRGIAEVGAAAALSAYAAKHGIVTIGVAGAGQMGADLAVQLSLMPGVRLGAFIEKRIEVARGALRLAGRDDEDVIVASSAAQVDRAIEQGKIAIAEDVKAVCGAGRIDVIVDATGNPNMGVVVALESIAQGKQIVMLNVEADVTIGRFLKEEARKAGVVYTGAAGDEPAAIIELIGLAQALGLDIISAGKGKNNALQFDATPDAFEEEARRRNMNPRVLVEFVDGSKTMVEMTAVANATGLVPDVPGMHGPSASLERLPHVLCTREDGGILSAPGRVDYTIGPGVAPGVFCIVKPKHPRLLERMADLKVGPGPNFALLRPFHLTSMEVPLSAIKAVREGMPDLQPLDRPVAECAAVAKRDLQVGQVLGRIGQYDYRGFTMRWEEARDGGALPMGLAERSKVVKPIRAGEKLTYENCVPDDTLLITQLRRRLDQADARFL